MIDLAHYPSLARLVDQVLQVFPEHTSLATKSFEDRPAAVMASSEQTASLIATLATHNPGGMEELCTDYRFLCEKIVPPEELFFRRNGRYRLSSFKDAQAEVYANAPFMKKYMNGLLVSDVMWNNHAHSVAYYVNTYLPSIPGGDHLEIGPGHGIFLYYAATRPNFASVTGWDISPTSIAHTESALKILNVPRPVTLTLQNLYEGQAANETRRFDSIVLSEILEHVEDPVAALRAVRDWLKPGGRVWVNVPSNSPAPDHLFLFDSPEHACEIVKSAGYEIEDSAAYAMTGTTLEKARRRKLAISCLVTGRLPA